MKPPKRLPNLPGALSHPAGVRGLKPMEKAGNYPCQLVAPRRGAWVETAMTGLGFLRISSRAPQGAWVETPMVWDKKLGT